MTVVDEADSIVHYMSVNHVLELARKLFLYLLTQRSAEERELHFHVVAEKLLELDSTPRKLGTKFMLLSTTFRRVEGGGSAAIAEEFRHLALRVDLLVDDGLR